MVLSVAFDNSGTRLLSSGTDNQTQLWRFEGEELTWLKAFKAQEIILWASFSPDSQHIATVGRELLVCIYSIRDYQEKHCFKGHQSTIYRAIFSPDNQQVVTISADATIRFWDLSNHSELFTLTLPVIPSSNNAKTPLWDFDFRCAPQGCWIAVPLTHGKLALYELGQIYK
jgi:WD40 repeat protein